VLNSAFQRLFSSFAMLIFSPQGWGGVPPG
jgi:hypothetical protein